MKEKPLYVHRRPNSAALSNSLYTGLQIFRNLIKMLLWRIASTESLEYVNSMRITKFGFQSRTVISVGINKQETYGPYRSPKNQHRSLNNLRKATKIL